jgi:formylglycine-generating enzyme required for sulfatase activity
METIEAPYDVFVAYSRRDARDFSERLANRLKLARLRVFIDGGEVEEGTSFDASIIRAVKSCRIFLFVMSPASVADKSYARSELDWAKDANRTLLSIHAEHHDGVKPPPALDGVPPISTEGDRIAQAVEAVLKRLERPERRGRDPWHYFSWTAGAVAAALLLLGFVHEPGPIVRREYATALPPARPEMARVGGSSTLVRNEVRVGISSPEAFMAWCKRLKGDGATCRERAERLRARAAIVSTFDIDRTEVSAQDFAEWIQRKISHGKAIVVGPFVAPDCQEDILGPLVQRPADRAPLWRPACCGLGAHEIAKDQSIQATGKGKPWDIRQAVACVSAEAASWYCSDRGKRLPTEEEWELAAGGMQNRWLPWAREESVRPECTDAVFDRGDGGVCQHLPNLPAFVHEPNRDVTPQGVRALGGNVSEWVVRSSQDDVPSRTFAAKGGNWSAPAIDMHPAKVLVEVNADSADYPNVGFRCARSPADALVTAPPRATVPGNSQSAR